MPPGDQNYQSPAVQSEQLPPSPPPAKTPRKRAWIIAGTTAILLILLGAGGWLLNQQRIQREATEQQKAALERQKEDPQTVAVLQEKRANLSEAELRALDKDTLFFTVLKNQNMQPVAYVKNYLTFDNNPLTTLTESSFDYRTKQLATQENQTGFGGTLIIGSRCLGGTKYVSDAASKGPVGDPRNNGLKFRPWRASEKLQDDTAVACGDSTGKLTSAKAMSRATIGDGTSTGGMTAEQAEKFNQTLRRYGVIKVNGATLVSRGGKQYIRLDMHVVPQKFEDTYWGMQTFVWAFQASGLNPSTHPYTMRYASGAGQHAIYYIDPASLLPVYARFDATPALNSDGQPKEPAKTHQQTEYAFPQSVAQTPLENIDVLTFDWLNQEK